MTDDLKSPQATSDARILVPYDTVSILRNLVLESKSIVQSLSLMNRLLLSGAIIDAEGLLEQIDSENGVPTSD